MLNTGVAFGMAQGMPFWVGLLAISLLLLCALKTRELWGRVGIGLIVVGGAMNTYQRLTTGAVVDNLPMFHFGYNNFADYLIFFGVLVYGYTYFVRRRGSSRN